MTRLTPTEEAIRLALVIERADGDRATGHSLGFALINYGRLFVRDYWTLFAIARELDCGVSDLVPREDRAAKRAKWDSLVRASEQILLAVRALPAPLRDVTEARARGESWRRIIRSRTTRLLFSLQEDFEESLKIVQRRAPEAVALLASEEGLGEKYLIVKRRARA